MSFTAEELRIINTGKNQPSVSIVMPVFPGDINYRIRQAERQVHKALSKAYPEDVVKAIATRLQAVIDGIDMSLLKKSLAIYISPQFSELFHLDIAVDEKIAINQSFKIRDLVYARQESVQFLVVLLSSCQARILLIDSGRISSIPGDIAPDITAEENDIAAKVGNFSDPEKRKEILLDKFLHRVDERLSAILNRNPLPVFIVGAKRETGHFAGITHNGGQIASTIHGSYNDIPDHELTDLLKPYIKNWKQSKETALLQQLEDAQSLSLVDFGIHMVWKTANEKNARLLVVEKTYQYPAEYVTPAVIRQNPASSENTLFVKDAVDDVIEKVISDGGDVRFVDAGVLSKYLHIALIRYF